MKANQRALERGSWVDGRSKARSAFPGGPACPGNVWGQIFSEGSSIQAERNTPSHCLSLGGPGSDRLGLPTGLSQPGSLGVLVTTA